MGRSSRLRIALFTHDAYGLGHVRRSVRILHAVAERAPDAVLLLITGSPAVDALSALPATADYIKLPTIVTSGTAGTAPPVLEIGVAELASLRGAVTRQVVQSFAPDVFLVDNFPLGTRLELLPALQAMAERGTKTVLGLRDILDPPKKVRTDWSRDGLYEIVDRYYDRVLVYGAPVVLDVAEAYAFPAALAAKVHYCGYVTLQPPAPHSARQVRTEMGIDGPFIVATVGGGGDGLPVLRTFIQALPLIGDVASLIVTGEFMAPDDRAQLRALAGGHPRLRILEHVSDLPTYLAAADVVVAMGGYNTAAELLATRTRAVLVPRTWRAGEHGHVARTGVDGEQLQRAEALHRLGVADMLPPDDLTPERLAARVSAALAAGHPAPELPFELGGAGRAAQHLLDLARA